MNGEPLAHRPRETIQTASAPAPIGPYSQAVAAGPFVFTSGVLGVDPASGALSGDDAAGQTRAAMKNLGSVLAAAGLAFADIVKTTIFLIDMSDFRAVNEVYAESFAGVPPPARTTVAVAALPRGARVEIESIALRR
jgi:2-iminobutanoate/2-iminopropanoate deaminase